MSKWNKYLEYIYPEIILPANISESFRPEERRGACKTEEGRPSTESISGSHCKETVLKVQEDANQYGHEHNALNNGHRERRSKKK